MIFLSLNKVPSEQSIDQDAVLYATIRDSSKMGFSDQVIKVYWRVKGTKTWKVEAMNNADDEYHWYGTIPVQTENTEIEYYVEANSESGKSGRRPITAPRGFYTFKYVSQH